MTTKVPPTPPKPEPPPALPPKPEQVSIPKPQPVPSSTPEAPALQTPPPPVVSKEPDKPAEPVPQTVEPVKQAEPLKPAIASPGDAPVKSMEFAEWQVGLERQNFSCGTIDGDFGMRSHRALHHFQKSRGLPITGELDIETRISLGKPVDPFTPYTVTEDDMKKVQPTPTLWRDKAKATYLGYSNPWEMVAEKFHTTPKFLKELNPFTSEISAGTSLTVPNLTTMAPLPKLGSIEIILSQTTILLYDEAGKLVACFPCSIAADKNKRPNGELKVVAIAPNPNYTFNPAVLVEAAQAEGITSKLIIPPGPKNPVGLAWISLSLPGYGIHGTPNPSDISRTGSHGCFRLANWNATRLLKAVKIGIPVKITE